MDNYEAYCDGSYQDSIKSGGWSSIILCNGKIIKKLYQGLKNTTNNRCEILGVLETLKYFKEPVNITIYSDSQYVVGSINSKSVFKWFDEQDYSKKNLDLWFQVIELLKFHNVTIVWVKGHENTDLNNKADMLCVHAAQCLNIPTDAINKFNIQEVR